MVLSRLTKLGMIALCGLLFAAASAGEPTPEELKRLKEMLRKGRFSDRPEGASRTKPGERRRTPDEGRRGEKAGREDLVPSPAPDEKEKLSAFERYVRGESSAKVSTDLKQFGYDFFKKPAVRLEPVTAVAAGPDYVLGPNDEVIVRIWGKVELEAAADVDRGGKLALPKIGVFPVAGQSLGELRKNIRTRYDKIFNDYKMDVSLGALRRVGVLVVGKVRRPGRYGVSSVATVLNALMEAGGPNKTGTLRSIQLRRRGKRVATLDVYKLLTAGERSGDVRLQPEDTVFVPGAGRRVAIAGDVRNPAIYELKPDEMKLRKLIELAGGTEPTASKDRVQIERVERGGKVRLERVDLTALGEGRDFDLRDGDIVRVFSVVRKISNAVYLAGNVARPGTYRFKKGMRVSDLISDLEMLVPEKEWKSGDAPRPIEPESKKPRLKSREKKPVGTSPGRDRDVSREDRGRDSAGRSENKEGKSGDEDEEDRPAKAFPQPYWEHALIRRITRPQLRVEYIPFNLGKALLKKDRSADLPLFPGDTVIVFSKWDFAKRPTARVAGAVNRVGAYPLTPNMTVRDLVSVAGGLKRHAYRAQAELLRVHFEEAGQREERILLDLSKILSGDAAQNLKLRERDQLFVRSVPEYKSAARVKLSGEVRFPGTYPIRRRERLSSLIERAGGYTDRAYLLGAEFTRESVRKIQQQRIEQMLTRLETQLSRTAAGAAQTGVTKEAIEAASEQAAWQQTLLGRLRSVKAKGRVVLKLAQIDKLKGSSYDIFLEDRDAINIPARPDTVNVLGTVHNQNAYLWKKKATYKYYLRLAGGPTRFASKKGIYVIRADGSVTSLRQGRRGLRWDPEHRRWVSGGLGSAPLAAGDTIVVPEELDHVAWLRNTKDITQILYQIAVATGIVVLAF